jgi:ABC-type glycerol-3-phosphate transport system permease component
MARHDRGLGWSVLGWCEDQGTLEGCWVSSRVGQLDIQRHFFYSVLILVLTVAGLIFCWTVGYALAKMEIPGKKGSSCWS